jgi:hypothetical protein
VRPRFPITNALHSHNVALIKEFTQKLRFIVADGPTQQICNQALATRYAEYIGILTLISS